MSKTTKNLFLSIFKYDKVLSPFLVLILPGIVVHSILEYSLGGFSIYFIRDLINMFTVFAGLTMYIFSIVNKKDLILISVYSIVSAITMTFVIGINDPDFRFEPLFLQAEMIISLLLFAVGMLVHFKHAKTLSAFNVLFIVLCLFTTGRDFPIVKFIYYGILVGGAGLVSFLSQRAMVRLSRKVKEANKLIEIQNKELKEMNRSKDQLFRIIGHDLRTPFHQLTSLTEMIGEVSDEQERQEITALIKESAGKGRQLLEDLLGWGNTYQEQSKIVLEKQSIFEIVESVFEFFNMKREFKKIELINEVSGDLKLMINVTMMETVLRNLIANALKFSNRGSEIIVLSEQLNNQVRIAVVDKGVGISKEKLQNLFQSDKNESTVGTENEPGSGFGLSISKKLVEKQKGTFEVQSEHHKGTVINMYFPTY